jgi:hypothetical protein
MFRRFIVLALLVVTISMTRHFFHASLLLIWQNQHGSRREAFSWFSIVYYLATDFCSLTAGIVTLRQAHAGMPLQTSRVLVFTSCAVLTR